jgi:hypothetical protein
MNDGSVPPDSVEDKAHTLTRQTLDAIRPVTGPAGTSADSSTWQKCTTETPGRHRFPYTCTLELPVPQDQSEAVMDAANAHFTQQGCTLGPSDGQNTRAGATLPKSTGTVGPGVKDSSTVVIQAGSDRVFTTHDPTAAGNSS